MTVRGQFVYFIRPVGRSGPIKIGCSTYPTRRLEALAAWSPDDLEIVTKIPGGFDLEREIHAVFADLHLRREWFRAEPRLIDAVARLVSGEPVEKAIDFTNRPAVISKKAQHWLKHPENRLRASYSHRLTWALNKAGPLAVLPKDVAGIIVRWRGYGWIGDEYHAEDPIQPTGDELRRLDQVLSNPGAHMVQVEEAA